jgi:hypothetical protein
MFSVNFDGIWLELTVVDGNEIYARTRHRSNSLKKKGICKIELDKVSSIAVM